MAWLCRRGSGGRQGDADTRDNLVCGLREARAELVDLIDAGVPDVLTRGLAAALFTLAATVPVAADVAVRGDLDAADPLARALWLVASDAATNAVKHADASRLRIELAVDAATASIVVRDDGRGGLTRPPASIADRAANIGGALTVTSPVGGGTEITMRVDRARVSSL